MIRLQLCVYVIVRVSVGLCVYVRVSVYVCVRVCVRNTESWAGYS